MFSVDEADVKEQMLGIKKFAVAMLRQTADDIAKGRNISSGGHDEAARARYLHSSLNWINQRTEGFMPFSVCCDILDRNPDQIRQKILSDPQAFVEALRGNRADDSDYPENIPEFMDGVKSGSTPASAARPAFRA